MRTKSSLVVVLAVALAAAGCGSSKSVKGPNDQSSSAKPPPAAKANKQLKAPSAPQTSSATKSPGKRTIQALSVEKAGKGKAPQLKGLEGKSIEEKLTIFAQDIGSFWQNGFSEAQVQFEPATTYLVSSPQQIGCDPPGTVSPTDTPFYCAQDSSLSLPVESLDRIDQNDNYGDAAVATIVGAFYGLHVENVVGLLKGRPDRAVLETAVCLDGVWARSVYKRNLLDPGDLDKIGRTLSESEGEGGSSRTLVDAFNAGYSSGDPGKCVQDSGDPGMGG
jgi:predicted metalloprotease